MGKRMILALGVAALALAAGAGAAVLSAGSGPATKATVAPAPKTHPTTDPAAPVVLHFVSKDSSDHYVDAKPSGLSAGDVLAQHSTWFAHGKKVGAMALTATVTLRTSDQTGEVMFTAVGRLNDGDVTTTGTFDIVPENQTFDAAITGGTGANAGARGHAVFEQVSAAATRITLNFS
jgi:hypothetical protein